jgi:integrase
MPTEFTIGRLNGRFVVTWREDGKRRRYRLAARTKREAEAEALDVVRKEVAAPVDDTIAGLWEEYRAFLGDRKTAETMGYTGKAILPHFGALRPDQIKVKHCRDYAAARVAEGRKQGAIHTELGHLRSAVMFAEKHGMIARAPFIWRPEKPAPKDRWLNHAEIDRLLDAAISPHIRLAILLMLTTAGRVGAVLELTWDRVDMDRAQIDLRLDATGPRKGRAVVPINSTLRAALSVAAEDALSDYVVEYAGERVKSIRTGIDATTRRAGLEGVSAHTMRHTAGVHMAAAGISMDLISQFMGHSNTSVTQRVYARFAPEHMAEAANVLNFTKARKVQ